MPTVFISYRQTSDTERQRVCAFAKRLSSSGIEVILDQFFLEDHPGGPNDGWDKWSSDRALNTSHVIIIGSESWFQCFDKTQPPGTGFGSACEADDIRHRVYEANGIVETIRIVLFDDRDAQHISPKLRRYHRFHADRDFEHIIRWLGGTASTSSPATALRNSTLSHSSFRSNLPTIQRFFGRDTELDTLRVALHPDATGWGALIDGPGGMGKTTLAIRAAELAAPGHFDDIVFLSAKQTAMDPHGLHNENPFAVSGFTQMLDAIARRLQMPEITQAPADERPRLLIDALTGTRTLLVLDNLETLTDADQRRLSAFLNHLPRTCKALLTSRPLIITTGGRIKLQQLDQTAALQTLADIARDNPALASAPVSDRLRLITETGGNTLLLTWAAWQVGSGYCTTIDDALAHLRSCPPENDPLEFIFGDLLARFTTEEEHIVATLSYPTEPITVIAIAEISGVDESTTRRALKILTNRSIVFPQDGEEKYALVPMAADFMRYARPEVVKQIGDRLADRAFCLINENGHKNFDRFSYLDIVWSSISPALPLFLASDNARLQTVCDALNDFLKFRCRWDERISLNVAAEAKALDAGDHLSAGWRAYRAGTTYYRRRNINAVFSCACRALQHWSAEPAGVFEHSTAILLRGMGHQLNQNYSTAISDFREAFNIRNRFATNSKSAAIALHWLAKSESLYGDHDASERHYLEALHIAQTVNYPEGVAYITCNLAGLALERKEWPGAEKLAREALALTETLERLDLTALIYDRLSRALVRQSKTAEARVYAQKAVDISGCYGLPDLAIAQATLAECVNALEAK